MIENTEVKYLKNLYNGTVTVRAIHKAFGEEIILIRMSTYLNGTSYEAIEPNMALFDGNNVVVCLIFDPVAQSMKMLNWSKDKPIHLFSIKELASEEASDSEAITSKMVDETLPLHRKSFKKKLKIKFYPAN